MTAILSDRDATRAILDELFERAAPKRVAFRLWDGSVWPSEAPREATFILKHPGALRAMFGTGTEKALAEAYLRDDFDIVGNLEAAFELADLLGERADSWLTSLRTYLHLRRLPSARSSEAQARVFGERDDRRHSVPRDREAVSFHYDLSNEFYQLWLDPRMVYSCAYFERPEVSLADAQEAKLRHLCRKLRLQPGQRLLDIGCGWGGLAIYAAQHFGVSVTGVTLSAAQVELARKRIAEAGLVSQVTIELLDYRDLRLRETYDAIVSVGMSEHVGRAHLPEYFNHALRHLRPGGVFLNHAIGEGARPRARRGPSFIEEYVFPDSDIPPLPIVLQAAESAGFEIRDVENLREHYARTLRHWVTRLESAHDRARQHVNEATFRVWRLYMAGSAVGFARGQLAVYQTLLLRPDSSGNSRLPLTRADWYAAS